MCREERSGVAKVGHGISEFGKAKETRCKAVPSAAKAQQCSSKCSKGRATQGEVILGKAMAWFRVVGRGIAVAKQWLGRVRCGTAKRRQISRKGNAMKEPKGKDLLATLIDLLADQEGVKIKYVIEERTENEEEIQSA